MVSLLSNLIDNSIESCEKVNSDSKSIYFTIKANNITLINDKIKDEKPIYNIFFTSKTEKNLHGYGMKIIRDIVKKYNGDIQVEDYGDIFQLSIEFYEQ